MKEREKIVPDAESRQIILDMAAMAAGIFVVLFAPPVSDIWSINETAVLLIVTGMCLGIFLLVRISLLPPNRYLMIACNVALIGSVTNLVMALLPGHAV